MKKLVLDNDSATVWVYPEKKIIHHQFNGFMHGDIFRGVMLAATKAFVENRCTKWLSDDRKNSALPRPDLEWAEKEWEPVVIKAGWKHWAIVVPVKVVGQMSMKRLAKRLSDLNVNVKLFSDPKDALLWLEQQQ